jgi:hypothetical protein
MKAGESIPLTVTMSEIVLSGGTITATTNILNGGTPKTVVLTANSTGTTLTGTYAIVAGDGTSGLPVKITGYTTTVTDLASNPLASGSSDISIGNIVYVDTVAPIGAITYSSTGPYKNGETVVITATFTEPMIDSPRPKIVIIGTGIAHTSAVDMTKITTTEYKYDYPVPIGDGSGVITLTTGTDLAGNLIVTNPSSGSSFSVDNTVPIISGVTTSVTNGDYIKAGETIPLTATISEIVLSGGTITATTNIFNGGNPKTIVLIASQQGNTLTGTYTIVAGDGTGGTAVKITGYVSTVTDIASNPLGSGSSDISIGNIVYVDTTAPTISTIITSAINGNYIKAGDTIPLTVSMSKIILGGGAITAITNILNGGNPKTVVVTANSTGTTLTGIYTVASGDTTSELPVKITGYSATISDLASNPLAPWSSDISIGNNVYVDAVPPILTQVTPITTHYNITTPSYVFTSDTIGTISSSLGFSSSTTSVNGQNTITFTTLVDNIYSGQTITVTDIAGNYTTLTMPNFTIDTVAPSPPTVTFPVNNSNENTVTITLGSGATTWRYSTDTGNTWINGSGNSFTLSDAIYAINRVRITNSDAATNISSIVTNTTQLIIKTVPEVYSTACFLKGTPINTDQGPIEIQNIIPSHHTIRGNHVRAIIKTCLTAENMVLFKKNCMGDNYPSRDTVISWKHKIYYNGEMHSADSFVSLNIAEMIPYEKNTPVYNVMLHIHTEMITNNMIVETQNPNSMIGRLYEHFLLNDNMPKQQVKNAVELTNEFFDYKWTKYINENINKYDTDDRASTFKHAFIDYKLETDSIPRENIEDIMDILLPL